MLGLLGASGCGKSMTLKCIAGVEKPDEGRIVLDGRVLFDSEKDLLWCERVNQSAHGISIEISVDLGPLPT